MMRKLAYSLLMILCGAVLTISAIFVMMAFSRVFPASDEFQQSCRKFDAEEIKTKFIQSWFRMAAKDDRLEKMGLSKVAFITTPSFADNAWSGKLLVIGEKSRYSAYVILNCHNGYYDYTDLSEGEDE